MSEFSILVESPKTPVRNHPRPLITWAFLLLMLLLAGCATGTLPVTRGRESQEIHAAVVDVWLSTSLGGEVTADPKADPGRPMRAIVAVPGAKVNCDTLLRFLVKTTVRHQVIQDCRDVPKEPIKP